MQSSSRCGTIYFATTQSIFLKWRMTVIKTSLQTIMMMIKIMTNRLMMTKKITDQCRSQEAEEIIGKIQCVLEVNMNVCLGE